MVKQILDRGTVSNDGTGDTLRNGAQKINDNFTEIYNAIGDGTNLNPSISLSDDTSTLSNISLGDTITFLGTGGISASLSGNTLTIDASGVQSGYTIKNASSILNRRTYLKFDGTYIIATDNSGNDETVIALSSNLQSFNTKIAPNGDVIGSSDSQVLTNKTIDFNANTLNNFDITLVDDSSSSINVNPGSTLNVQGGTGITTSLTSDSSGLNTLTITGVSQAFDNIIINEDDSTQTTLSASTSNTLNLVAGTSIIFETDQVTNTITISAAELTTLTYTSQSFVGDDSTTSFTLSSSDRSVEDILVVVNGFIYEPTVDYTITGSTLNITEAPPAGSEIRIRYFPITAPLYPGSVDTQTLNYSSVSLTGDGSTQTFGTTSGDSVPTPDATSNENVLVVYNGILLFPIEDYTMGSNSITFTEAPVADAEIEIRFLPSKIRN
jgi:hypothetical protein